MMSNLDDMWHTNDKESNIQDFEDEDSVDNEDIKEEMNAYVAGVIHVPHDEMEEMQKGNKYPTPFVDINSLSVLQDKPRITLVEKASRLRYMLKSQDIFGINDDIIKCSCTTNGMNSMHCANDDHVDRLEFLENEKEATFMFEPFDSKPNEPLPKDELSAMYETYNSFNYTSTFCYNLHVVLILDTYVCNNFL
jgi:hypothetical protein